MRLLFLVLFVLVGLIQYPLWLGKGGWFKVWDCLLYTSDAADE